MGLATLRGIEEISTSTDATPYKRAFASGILLMPYASLGSSDVQRIRSIECNEDAGRGTLLSCKTKKQHGQNWLWARTIGGVGGSRERANPIVDMRAVRKRLNGAEPSFTFMRPGHAWQLIAADPSPYAAAPRKLALVCVSLGGPEGERYTIHSPKNLLPTAASQLKFDQRGLNIIGRWPTTSKDSGEVRSRYLRGRIDVEKLGHPPHEERMERSAGAPVT